VGSASERRRAETVEAVTNAALTVFERQGYDPTRVEDVAHEAGISRRTVFRHFAGKDDLLRGFHDRWLIVFADHLGPDQPGGTPRDAIEPALLAIAAGVLADPGPILRVHRLLEQVPALQAAWTRYEHEWRDALFEVVERQHATDPHVARITAAAIATNLFNALTLWSRRPERTDLSATVERGFTVVDQRERGS